MNLLQIENDLRKASVSKNYLFYGSENFFIDRIAKTVENDLMPEEQRAFNFHILYGKETNAEQIVDTARRIPMASDRQIICIKEAQAMRDFAKLVNYLKNPTLSTNLYIFYKKNLDKRKKESKAILQLCESHEFKPLYDNQIPNWILSELKRRRLEQNPESAELLAQYLGTDLAKISNALDKLELNLDDSDKVLPEMIRKVIGIDKDYDVFSLQSAISERNWETTWRILNYYGSNPKNNPLVLVISSLYGFFSNLLRCQLHGVRGINQVKSYLNLYNPSALKDYARALSIYNVEQTKRALHILHIYDLKSKGYNSGRMKEVSLLKELIYKIMQ